MSEHDRPRNVCIWIIGPDTDPQALEIEQSDGNVYLLCKVSECDVMFLGYMVSKYAHADGLILRQSLTSKLTGGG